MANKIGIAERSRLAPRETPVIALTQFYAWQRGAESQETVRSREGAGETDA